MSRWPTVTLDDVSALEPRAITDGPFGSNLKTSHYVGEGPRVIRLQNIGEGKFIDSPAHITVEHFERLRKHEVVAGDLLVASLGERLPRACLMPAFVGPAIVKADCIRVRLGQSVDPRWVMYALMRPEAKRWAEGQLHGLGRPRLGLKNVRTIPIPLPSLAEQRLIVEILEDHLSRLDAGDDLLRIVTQRTNSYEDSFVMSKLGIAADGDGGVSKLIATSVPALPAGWEWMALSDVAEVVGGVTKDAKKQSDPMYVEVPYLRVANVQRGRLDLDRVTTIRVPPAKAEALALRPGDVLMNEGGDRDKLARGWIWQGQIDRCIHQNHVFRARPRNNVRPEWLAWCANTYGSRWAQQHGRQSVNLASISMRVIKTMPIPVPPLSVQDEALLEIREAISQGRRTQVAVDRALVRSRQLRRALLSAAFSGRLTGAASDVDRVEELAEADV